MPAGDCPPSGRHDARASLSTARTPQCQGHVTERGQLQDVTRPMSPSSTRLRHTGHRLVSGAAAQNADRFTRNRSFSAQFNEVACGLGSTTPRVADSLPSDGGNCIIRDLTRRRHAASQLLMPQNPHTRRHGQRRIADKTGRNVGWRDKTRPARALPRPIREKTRPTRGFRRLIREKVRPASPKTPKLGCFQPAGRTFSRSRPPSGPAGRTISRTGRSDVAALKLTTPLQPLTRASMKPPSPLRAPQQQPLKPVAPLQPKNAPNAPIFHPQRQPRFQLRLALREQRC